LRTLKITRNIVDTCSITDGDQGCEKVETVEAVGFRKFHTLARKASNSILFPASKMIFKMPYFFKSVGSLDIYIIYIISVPEPT
jgi:hypothetical protein